MKSMRSQQVKIIIVLICLIALPFAAHVAMAQPPPPPPPPPPPAGVPLDGGLTLLLAGLGAYGLKKFFGKTE